MTLQRNTTVEWIARLAQVMPEGEQGALLRTVVEDVSAMAVAKLGRADSECLETAGEYCRSRLTRGRSKTFAADLVGMARDKDDDVDQWLFCGEPEACVLVADSEIHDEGTALLERYLDYRDNHPEYELVHPSDYSRPKEKTADLEWERLVDDFAELIRDWRDGFLAGLMEDAGKDGE